MIANGIRKNFHFFSKFAENEPKFMPWNYDKEKFEKLSQESLLGLYFNPCTISLLFESIWTSSLNKYLRKKNVVETCNTVFNNHEKSW